MSRKHARSRLYSQRAAEHVLSVGHQMGRLLQQIRLWVPALRPHSWSPFQQWRPHEPPSRQKVSMSDECNLPVLCCCTNETWKQWLTAPNFPFLSFLVFRTVHYYAELGQCSVFPATDAPEQFISQVTVLKYFSHYMEENLMDVSTVALERRYLKQSRSISICIPLKCV